MKRSQPLIAVCALACAGLSSVRAASGQTAEGAAPAAAASAAATRFELRSPAGCGSAADFVAKVQRRSSRIRLRAEAPGGRSLIVEIQPPNAAGALLGTVTVVEADGASRARKLKAKSCEEAMEGLSLIATVTLDPEALLSEPVEEPPKAAPPLAPPPLPKTAPQPQPPTLPATPRYRLSFGLAMSALFRQAPEPAFGGSVAVALELRPGEVWSPSLRLAVVHAQRRGIAQEAGDANFAFTLPTLDACPVRLGSPLLGVRPCAYASVGLLKVWGTAAAEREEHQRLSGSAGASLHVLLRLSKALEIIADGRAGPALLRDDFAFDDVGFFRTPALLFSAGAGLAGGFP